MQEIYFLRQLSHDEAARKVGCVLFHIKISSLSLTTVPAVLHAACEHAKQLTRILNGGNCCLHKQMVVIYRTGFDHWWMRCPQCRVPGHAMPLV